MSQSAPLSRTDLDRTWWTLVYGRGHAAPRPDRAVQLLRDRPEVVEGDPILACGIGAVARVAAAVAADPAWVARRAGPFELTPLLATTHSSLIRRPEYQAGILECARLLLAAGADLTTTFEDPAFPGSPLSVLYGAAGRNHHPDLTTVLLEAGADPNDGESLYHSVESADPTCTTLLLRAGARVPGSNALRHQLDYDRLEGLRQLLAHGADPNETGGPSPLLWAIRRGRSLEHIDALLAAGADPVASGHDGVSPYRAALAFGAVAVADRLRALTGEEEPGPIEQFIAACARADDREARTRLDREPDLFARMTPRQRSLLPELAALGRIDAVRVMVELGWPIESLGGDWQASALNLAVFNGDPALAKLLLAHGARWDTRHGFGGDVLGTLSWASINQPVAGGDWVGCAQALVEAEVPHPPADAEFGSPVADYFAQVRAGRHP